MNKKSQVFGAMLVSTLIAGGVEQSYAQEYPRNGNQVEQEEQSRELGKISTRINELLELERRQEVSKKTKVEIVNIYIQVLLMNVTDSQSYISITEQIQNSCEHLLEDDVCSRVKNTQGDIQRAAYLAQYSIKTLKTPAKECFDIDMQGGGDYCNQKSK